MTRYPILGLTKVFHAAGMTMFEGAEVLGLPRHVMSEIGAKKRSCSTDFVSRVAKLTGVAEKVVRELVVVDDQLDSEVHSSSISLTRQNEARRKVGLDPLV